MIKIRKKIALLSTVGVLMSQSMMLSAQAVDIYTSWMARPVEDIRASIEQISSSAPKVYIIQWGDTLTTIAEAAGMSVESLVMVNEIQNPDFIVAGDKLLFDYENHTVAYAAQDGDITVYSTETKEEVQPTKEELQAIENEVETATQLESTESESNVLLHETDEWVSQGNAAIVETSESKPTETTASSVESNMESVESISTEDVTESTTVDDVTSNESSTSEPEEKVEEQIEEPKVAPVEETSVDEEVETNETSEETPVGRAMTVEATAYSYQEAGLSNYTADGTNLLEESNVIAVDPSVIPIGTRVYIPGYGYYRAADTGGAIIGNRIDVHFSTYGEAIQFGRQTLTIYILD